MKFLKIGVKAGMALAAAIWGASRSNLLMGLGAGAICYMLLTYYMWYMKRCGGGCSIFIESGGLLATLVSFAFMVFSPLIPLVILAYLLSGLHVPEFVLIGLTVLVVIVAAGFMACDIGRTINPDFLGAGMRAEWNNGNC